MSVWVSTAIIKAQNTPYQRNKSVIFILTPWTRRKESSSSSFSVSRSGQILELRDSHDDSLSVDMQLWRSVAVELITSQLPNAVSLLIPESCRQQVQAFNFSNIVDDFSQLPVYLQPENTAKLRELIDPIVMALLSPSTPDCCLVDSDRKILDDNLGAWLRKEQTLLGVLAAIFALTSGPCFRSFQFSKLQYSGTPACDRNLYFFSSTLIGLVNPPAKQLNVRVAPTALLFPPSASRDICIYFFVLRAVGEHVLRQAGKDIPGYSSTIWVNPIPDPRRKNRKHEWTGQDIDKAVQSLTTQHLGFHLNCAIVRQISHAVFRAKIPSLFNSPQCQTKSVEHLLQSGSLKEISSGCRIPMFPNMDWAACRSRLLVSEIWQGALGLEVLHPRLETLVHGSYIFPTCDFIDSAFNCARAAILRSYHIGQIAEPEERAVSAKDILNRKPFLQGMTVSQLPDFSIFSSDLFVGHTI